MATTNQFVQLPPPPAFSDIAEERHHRKQRLAGVCRLFGERRFNEGLAGHITVRDPEHPECFWVNPLGAPFRSLHPSDLILVNSEGTVLEGDRPLNLAAFMIHSAIHRARPEVISAAHAHPIHGVAWSTLCRPLDPISQDAAHLYGKHSVYADYNGAVFDSDEGDRIAKALGPTNVGVILRNHGLLTVGNSVDAAAWWFLLMERSCHVQLLAEAAGQPTRIASDDAASFAEVSGNYAYQSFQTMWPSIIANHPDLMTER